MNNIRTRVTIHQLQTDGIITRESYHTYQKYTLTVCESDRSSQEDFFLTGAGNVILHITFHQSQVNDITFRVIAFILRESHREYQQHTLAVCESSSTSREYFFSHYGMKCNLIYNCIQPLSG